MPESVSAVRNAPTWASDAPACGAEEGRQRWRKHWATSCGVKVSGDWISFFKRCLNVVGESSGSDIVGVGEGEGVEGGGRREGKKGLFPFERVVMCDRQGERIQIERVFHLSTLFLSFPLPPPFPLPSLPLPSPHPQCPSTTSPIPSSNHAQTSHPGNSSRRPTYTCSTP